MVTVTSCWKKRPQGLSEFGGILIRSLNKKEIVEDITIKRLTEKEMAGQH